MRFKSVILRRLSQCFLTNMPQMSQKRAVLLSPPLALRKVGGGVGWRGCGDWSTRAGCLPPPAAFCLPKSILQILSLSSMYCDMKRLECNELRNHYYNFSMTVCPQHIFLASDSIIPTYMCYTLATVNYYLSNTPSAFTPQVLAYTISSVSDVTLVLLQPLRQTLTILQDSVPRSHM